MLNEKKKVGIVLDNPSRDLNGVLLVAYELVQNQIDCYIIPMNFVNAETWVLDLDFIITNYIRKNNHSFIKKLINSKLPFGVLDTEGGIIEIKSYLDTIGDKILSSSASLYFCWGKTQAKHLINEAYYHKDSLVITGSPRYDFYNQTYLPLFYSTLPAFFKNNPYILVNTTFTLCNPKFKTISREKDIYIKDLGWSHELYNTRYQSQKLAMDGIISLVQKLSKIHSDLNFVLRPHPFENIGSYKDKLNNIENIHVIHEGSVDKWIAKSKAIIAYNCSTSYEAGLLNVPAFYPTYLGSPPKVKQILDASILCASENVLFKNINDVLENKYVYPESLKDNIQNIKENWFSGNDGLAHKRISVAILESIQNTTKVKLNKILRRINLYELDLSIKKMNFQFIKKIIRLILNIPYGKSIFGNTFLENKSFDKWNKSDKAFNKDEVNQIIKLIHRKKKKNMPHVEEVRNKYTDIYYPKKLLSIKLTK
tara:strand:+ start:731 stop:2173 length:1443 start_codon:yes stop_codon:yes gene_type:complete